jgi:hypothetical protein
MGARMVRLLLDRPRDGGGIVVPTQVVRRLSA